MARDGDDRLLDAIRQGLEGGRISLHVSYRKARRVDGFRRALVGQVGEGQVKLRDRFMPVSFFALVLWFILAQALGLEEIKFRVLGSPVSLAFMCFALVLLAQVMVYRKYIKPMQGPVMHRAAMDSADLFQALWQGGALALMVREGDDRISQSPRDDWRDFVRRVTA